MLFTFVPNSPHMSLDITWMFQGYRHFRLTGTFPPVGLQYPVQHLKLIVLLIPIDNDIELLQKKRKF